MPSAAGGPPAREWIVLSTDLLYPSATLGSDDWALWRPSRILAVDMELSALFVMASLRDLAAGGILTVDGDPTPSAEMSDYAPDRAVVRRGVERMLDVALVFLAGVS